MEQTATAHSMVRMGLTSAQVMESRERHGDNTLTPPEREPLWKQFLEKFDDPVIRILLIAAIISIGIGFVNGHYAEGIGIVVAVLLATVVAFWNEYQAGKEFDLLNRANDDNPISVIRDGNYTTVPKRDLVVSDLVLLAQGHEIPADGEVLESVSLQVNESALTGESLESDKCVASEAPHREQKSATVYPSHLVFRGTMVVDGHGISRLTAVGDHTEIGKTARMAAEDPDEETPLNRQLRRLSSVIGVVGFGVAGLLFIALVVKGYLSGELALSTKQWCFAGAAAVAGLIALTRVWLPTAYDFLDLFGKEKERPQWLEREGVAPWMHVLVSSGVFLAAAVLVGRFAGIMPTAGTPWMPAAATEEFLKYFMIAVTLIVVAVPEGLAMSVTLSLAYSMRRMTATNNLVRRMHACETIGAATVICTDKTGTLTTNKMRLHHPSFPSLRSEGAVRLDGSLLNPAELIHEAMAANSTATLDRSGPSAVAIGNPTEGALLMWLESRGVDYLQHRTDFKLGKQWTFSTERKYMGTLGVSSRSPEHVLHLKGAPEVLLDRCSRILTPEGAEPIQGWHDIIRKELEEYQSRGMRTLGFAIRKTEPGDSERPLEDVSSDLVWLGFAAISDPVREEVPAAIEACRRAGIEVKMVTGDNRETAQEIARQIGLVGSDAIEGHQVTGLDFGDLDEGETRASAKALRVLSRAKPLHKLKLVQSLKEQGHVVAVTGDGTNDAPALNHAHVGLAMGRAGTDVAKEASDIILLDDSFLSIVNAIMWGRSLYQNIQRFILFQLTINVAALGIALLGPFIGVKLPFTVTQMLWVNLIMDTFAALALAAEPPHNDVMNRGPRDPNAFIITPSMGRNITLIGGFFMVAMVGFLLLAKQRFPHPTIPGEINDHGLTLFFSIFVMMQFWNLFNARCLGLTQSAFRGILANRGLVIIALAIGLGQVAIVQWGGAYFRTVPLTASEWVAIIGGTSLVLVVGETIRWAQRLRNPEPA